MVTPVDFDSLSCGLWPRTFPFTWLLLLGKSVITLFGRISLKGICVSVTGVLRLTG